MKVAIAFGSNLGDRRAAIAFAAERLSPAISGLTLSGLIETNPEGEGLDTQPLYLNGVGVGETSLDARSLLELLLAIEREYGRERPYPGAPRTIDLDLILYGDRVIHEPGLSVPHPRFRNRFFVLGPLAEVAPDLVDPETGLRVGELLRKLLQDETR
ncbi:MAG: 2-amino-4-hydroxy-6-hydroxymethyldihydropteridine diphosphokinase [Acidobacteria bacterium RIFCSPLOWO2_02_FULL_67_36]|nr:MAG: 2-amino-4-hydroxy-6-hydroxymethyldihydropteridine diphosphokinase [Acidobacteria bacterium RIFCSPLOWO2_02_FULL_67_36]OFW18361.1 MAG: 2-amino-4-hydroxy-6-hydroxymethyldihydropteridine diphosphokinase [Acidobacteria bacterium RIFCSPLOWO2_12_FULL_66_21]